MTASLATSLPFWLTGGTYDGDAGDDLRNSDVTAGFYDEGIVTSNVIGVLGGVIGGAGLQVTAGGGLSVNVQPGSFVVPNTASPVSGGYKSTLTQRGNLTVQAADPSNPRIDIIVAVVTDNGNSTSAGAVKYIEGVAAASPSAPAPPANSITLAQISVPANATTVTSGDITDERTYTTATGGILIAPPGTVTGYQGMAAFDRVNIRFYHNSNETGNTQFPILPWKTAYATRNANFTISPSENEEIMSVTVTTDGFTDIEITTHWVGIFQDTPAAQQVVFTVLIDGVQLDEIDLQTNNDDLPGISHSGATSVYRTSSLSGDTPDAGTHTITFAGFAGGATGDNAVFVRCSATRNAYLRVEPAVL